MLTSSLFTAGILGTVWEILMFPIKVLGEVLHILI